MDEKSIDNLQTYLHPAYPARYAEQLEQPISSEELLAALCAAARRKSPGIDGMSLEFYTANWETVREELLILLNYMFLNKHISPRQKHGILACLPKSTNPSTLDDYRPISLLTTEYKLLARILARCLQQTLTDQLQKSQLCSVPGNSILDAISCVRDVLAHAEATDTPLCVLTLDCKQSFYRVSHHYLLRILRGHGISPWFVERIQALYDQASSSVQINGSLAGCIQIQSGIIQGCPLSVILYALCLHPLIRAVEDVLPSIRIGRRMPHGPVIAYADNVTVFVTHPEDFSAIQQAIRIYARATGSCLNLRKSKALAVGAWRALHYWV